MILELLLPDEFSKVLDWIARGELRQQLSELERQAGRSRTEVSPGDDRTGDNDAAGDDDSAPKTRKKAPNARAQHTSEADDGFSENFIRWAKLPPPLGDIDLSPYLHLAASFAGTPLIDVGLPERLRDIAANLTFRKPNRAEGGDRRRPRGLTTASELLFFLEPGSALLEHLGRMARDRPGEMIRAVGSILRIAETVPAAVASAEKALKALPAADIRPPVVLLFQGASASTFAPVLDGWLAHSSDQTTKNAIGTVRKLEGSEVMGTSSAYYGAGGKAGRDIGAGAGEWLGGLSGGGDSDSDAANDPGADGKPPVDLPPRLVSGVLSLLRPGSPSGGGGVGLGGAGGGRAGRIGGSTGGTGGGGLRRSTSRMAGSAGRAAAAAYAYATEDRASLSALGLDFR